MLVESSTCSPKWKRGPSPRPHRSHPDALIRILTSSAIAFILSSNCLLSVFSCCHLCFLSSVSLSFCSLYPICPLNSLSLSFIHPSTSLQTLCPLLSTLFHITLQQLVYKSHFSIYPEQTKDSTCVPGFRSHWLSQPWPLRKEATTSSTARRLAFKPRPVNR